MYSLDGSSASAVFRRQHLLGYVFVKSVYITVHEDTIAYLFLEERLDEIDDRVDERADVDHVHLLELRRVSFLHANQKLLHQRRRELGEMRGRRDLSVQDVNVAGHPVELLSEAHVADHQHQLRQRQDINMRLAQNIILIINNLIN